jgi:hypothetical protein
MRNSSARRPARVDQARLLAGVHPALLSGRNGHGVARTKAGERRVLQRNDQRWLARGCEVQRFPWRHGEPRHPHLLVDEFDVDDVFTGWVALLRLAEVGRRRTGGIALELDAQEVAIYARKSPAWSVAHSRKVRAGIPVSSANVDVTTAG